MHLFFLSLILSTGLFGIPEPITIGTGREPELTVDTKGVIRIIFGDQEKILYARSTNNGKTFSKPVVIAEIPGMHLGMERGPQLATSKDISVVTAMDKAGNIFSKVLDHATDKWKDAGRVNDINEIAKEGLMDLAADGDNNFFAVWLDLRLNNHNNIAMSVLRRTGAWQKNRTIYKSPSGKVCECCRPSIAVSGKSVAVMFRNDLRGNRDLYIMESSDGGKNFGAATKLGNGNWKLQACPMDGGGLTIYNGVATIWQRENQIFVSEPGMPETMLAPGRYPRIASSGNTRVYVWNDGGSIKLKQAGGELKDLGKGGAAEVVFLQPELTALVWEREDAIVFNKERVSP